MVWDKLNKGGPEIPLENIFISKYLLSVSFKFYMSFSLRSFFGPIPFKRYQNTSVFNVPLKIQMASFIIQKTLGVQYKAHKHVKI